MTLEQEILMLREENARLKEAKAQPLTVKISPTTGAIVIQGLGRFPTSLYAGQLRRLAAFMPTVLKFIDAPENQSSLALAEARKSENKAANALKYAKKA